MERSKPPAGSIEKVKSAAALYDADTGRILVIYEGSIKDTDEVLQQTADKVPPYMRPDEVIRIKQMPYNANGKIDRSAAAERILRCIAGSLRRGLCRTPGDPHRFYICNKKRRVNNGRIITDFKKSKTGS